MCGEHLLRSFENLTLDPERFDHEKHVEIAWLYVSSRPLPEAMLVFRDHLKRFATHAGAPEKYHETITFALLMLVAERRQDGESWATFKLANGDLFDDWRSLLHRYYQPETLASCRAKTRFVMPDAAVRAKR